MTQFTIQQRSGPKERLNPVADLSVIKDGFSWGAFFLGPLWFLNQGAWAVCFVDLAASVIFWNLAAYSDDPTRFFTGLGVSGFVATRIFFGFEGFDAIRDHMRSQGFVLVARTSGTDDEAALLVYMTQMPHLPNVDAKKPESALFPSGALAQAFGMRSRFGKGSFKS